MRVISINERLRNGLLGSLLCFMLTSCTVSYITKGDLSPNYRFPQKTQEGIAALTISCNMSDGIFSFYLSPAQSSVNLNDIFFPTRVVIFCNAPGQPLSVPQLKLINLPAGEYYFSYLYEFLGSSSVESSIHPLYFKVDSGKVNYLGWLQLEAGYNGLYTVKVKDGTGDDIPWIKQKLPLLQNQDIQIKPLSSTQIK